MRNQFSIPLIFFSIAALLGVVLRWHSIYPIPGLNYTYFLHAHSHTMFLGWVFNVFFLAFTQRHVPLKDKSTFNRIFIILQLLVVAMLISFPLQGYGVYSIILSTLHTVGAIVFIFLFLKSTKNIRSISLWYAKAALVFFIVSSLGPFSLAYIMSNGLGQSNWYYFAVYYYLHFQYNGFFILGIFSLFFQLLDHKQINYSNTKAKTLGMWIIASCLPVYFLSILWSQPGVVFNVISMIAAIAQLVTLYTLISLLQKNKGDILRRFRPLSINFLKIVLLAFGLKLVLQLISSHPTIAALTIAMRPIVIAYLHLVLLGVITLFILVWYIEMNLLSNRYSSQGLVVLFVGFIGTELCLVVLPWWSNLFGNTVITPSSYLLGLSAILLLSGLLFLISIFKVDKEAI